MNSSPLKGHLYERRQQEQTQSKTQGGSGEMPRSGSNWLCQHPDGGTKQAQDAKSRRCMRHGGGTRCGRDGCTKLQQRGTGFCVAHGGGKRCEHAGCGKAAQGGTPFCVAHGGPGRGKCGQAAAISSGKLYNGTDSKTET